MVSLARQYQITGLLEAVSVAEEDILDGLFAVSLETSLSVSENNATTIPSSAYDASERMSAQSVPANNTRDSKLDDAREVSIVFNEDKRSDSREDNWAALDTEEDEDMVDAEKRSCGNCGCIACKDGEVELIHLCKNVLALCTCR